MCMKIINLYILKEGRGPVVLSVSIFTFIFLLDIIVAMMENIIVKGISVFDVTRILSFYVPPILTQTLPLGLFVGIMITFSKFTRSSEAIAMNSIGMDIRAILKPILYLGVISMLFILFLQESIIPRSYIKLQYLASKIAYENPVFQLKERTFMNNLENYSLYIDRKSTRLNSSHANISYAVFCLKKNNRLARVQPADRSCGAPAAPG